jgi:DNA-binding HxlR family transcriptional regulator
MDAVDVTAQAATRFGRDRRASCRTVTQVLDRVGNKWTVMVVGSLADGPMRFNAILRLIGDVSHRMLTLTLRGMERDGLVGRRAYATIPPKVEYELTPLGRSLIEPLRVISQWALSNQVAIETARAAFDATIADEPTFLR